MRKFLKIIDKLLAAIDKGPFKALKKLITTLIILFFFLMIPGAIGALVFIGSYTLLGNEMLAALIALGIAITSMMKIASAGWNLRDYIKSHKKPITGTGPLEDRYIRKTMPHFGPEFDAELFDQVTLQEKYYTYIDHNGHSTCIEVNDSDKWIKIFNQYFPLDLIYGYNAKENVIYTIDGNEVRLPERVKKEYCIEEVQEFFESIGYNNEVDSGRARINYYKAFGYYYYNLKNDLKKEDWAMGRYRWEKAIANELYPKRVSKNAVMYDAEGGVNPEIYKRVLSQGELKNLAAAVDKGKISLEDILKFDQFINEYTLCNGVELIGLVDHSNKDSGLDFLFECLIDIDEACFGVAVTVLKTFAKDKLKAKIEEKAELAYESHDAMRLAGLLYLAKEINYKITFIEDLKNKTDDEEVRKFLVPEENAEPVAFEIGGMAFQEK
jgi:hypothetical protein